MCGSVVLNNGCHRYVVALNKWLSLRCGGHSYIRIFWGWYHWKIGKTNISYYQLLKHSLKTTFHIFQRCQLPQTPVSYTAKWQVCCHHLHEAKHMCGLWTNKKLQHQAF